MPYKITELFHNDFFRLANSHTGAIDRASMDRHRALMRFDLIQNNSLSFTIPSSFIDRFTNPQGEANNRADREAYRASMKPYTKKPPHATPEDERYLNRGVWHLMKSHSKPLTYRSMSSCFLASRKFGTRSKAVKKVFPAPITPPGQTAIQGIIDYTTAIPREIRDDIHANALPEVILVRDGMLDHSVRKLFVPSLQRMPGDYSKTLRLQDRV
jgi:hypothetical protein